MKKIEALYMGEEMEDERLSRLEEARVCEWLLKQRGREDLLERLAERFEHLGFTSLL